jgi:hypothetical protein
MVGLTKQEKRVFLFILCSVFMGGGVLLAKHLWPGFASELVIEKR